MKIRTIKRFVVAALGWAHWVNVVGLRADEQTRVVRQRKPSRERWTVAMPLAETGITKADVLAFWDRQPFDLELAGPWEGNCDGCFLKSRASIMRIFRDHPERMDWWARMESIPRGTAGVNRTFRADRESYAALADLVLRTPRLPFDETMHEMAALCDAGCGA